ncbi:hypothetical protein A4244_12745 [Bacillus badius]|nr:hypothetical protein A4244_12745 [Bacillus badius]OCS89309.1 hypothetical protein A6M11_12760 [Bacillus badius]OVE51311.1 hypothetical protein B1A98_13110 [Bacillus badius]
MYKSGIEALKAGIFALFQVRGACFFHSWKAKRLEWKSAVPIHKLNKKRPQTRSLISEFV